MGSTLRIVAGESDGNTIQIVLRRDEDTQTIDQLLAHIKTLDNLAATMVLAEREAERKRCLEIVRGHRRDWDKPYLTGLIARRVVQVCEFIEDEIESGREPMEEGHDGFAEN